MKKTSILIGAALAASLLAVSTTQAEAGWGWLNVWKGGKSVYQSWNAGREARRGNPVGVVERLLEIPPFSPYRYFPKRSKEDVRRALQKVDPAQRYGPEYRDLFE